MDRLSGYGSGSGSESDDSAAAAPGRDDDDEATALAAPAIEDGLLIVALNSIRRWWGALRSWWGRAPNRLPAPVALGSAASQPAAAAAAASPFVVHQAPTASAGPPEVATADKDALQAAQWKRILELAPEKQRRAVAQRAAMAAGGEGQLAGLRALFDGPAAGGPDTRANFAAALKRVEDDMMEARLCWRAP